MDFILNYKFNKDPKFDFKQYIRDVVIGYVNFELKEKKIYFCELPLPHLNDRDLLKVLLNENHRKNVNSSMTETDKYMGNITKVIPHKTRIYLYMIFNETLAKLCNEYQFTFLEINDNFENNVVPFGITTP